MILGGKRTYVSVANVSLDPGHAVGRRPILKQRLAKSGMTGGDRAEIDPSWEAQGFTGKGRGATHTL